jgi:steroid 5-alpha reductase family enzyme
MLLQINSWDKLGVLVWLCGMCIEHTADMQKTRWNSKHKSGQQKTWLAEGLWAWSRHPNFFGEHVLWWGSAIVVIAGLTAPGAATATNYSPFGCALAVISPIWSSFFLFFTCVTRRRNDHISTCCTRMCARRLGCLVFVL